MNEKEQLARLAEAQSLPHADLDDYKRYPKNLSEKEFEDYLKDFVKPTGECWLCQESLVLEWGLAHGVAHCANCGIDTKVYHYFEKDGRKERFETSLQTHPKHYVAAEE